MSTSWWLVNEDCPRCEGRLSTNGEYRKCNECNWSSRSMDDTYGDGNDHSVCEWCGLCEECGDCECEL